MRTNKHLKGCIGQTGAFKGRAAGGGLARTQAGVAARAELARHISVTISAVALHHLVEVRKGGAQSVRGVAEQFGKAVADDVKLQGSEIFATHVDNGTYYAFAVVCPRQGTLKEVLAEAGSKVGLSDEEVEAVLRATKESLGLLEKESAGG